MKLLISAKTVRIAAITLKYGFCNSKRLHFYTTFRYMYHYPHLMFAVGLKSLSRIARNVLFNRREHIPILRHEIHPASINDSTTASRTYCERLLCDIFLWL